MAQVEDNERELVELKQRITEIEKQIQIAQKNYAEAEGAGKAKAAEVWAEERRLLREEMLRRLDEKLLKEKWMATAGPFPSQQPQRVLLDLPEKLYEMIWGIVHNGPQPDQPEAPDVHPSQEEDEREELSLGGSKSDFITTEKALPRYGYQYLLEKRVTADGTVAAKFSWGPKREDDSSNMMRAVPFLQQQLEKSCNSKLTAVDVSLKQLLPKAEATPGKKTASKPFSTDVMLCPPEISARACENPRSCVSEALAITDFKKPVAFASKLRYIRGQALLQFIFTSLAAGHDVPTMATDLGSNTRIYHSEGEGSDRHVKELVFHNLGQALKYFGAVVDRVQEQIAPARLKLEEATEELQAISFAPARALIFEGDDELDLFEAEHSEAQREGKLKLPPIGHAKDYVMRLHQGVLRALDSNALTPSYISCLTSTQAN